MLLLMKINLLLKTITPMLYQLLVKQIQQRAHDVKINFATG